MERITETDLIRKYDNGGNNANSIIGEIKKVASQIIEIRKSNADTVNSYIETFEQKKTSIIENISDIKSELAKYHSDNGQYQNIIQLCDKVIENLNYYESNLKIINERFKNKKIKITTIGAARSGKSLFTQLFTGLSDDVIKSTKGSGDCTGAISNLCHDNTKKRGEFTAKITFHKEDDILNSINALMECIRESYKAWNPQCLPSKFNSIQEIRNYINKYSSIEEDLNSSNINISERNGLLAYFKDSEYLDWIGHEDIEIENNPGILSEYNYIAAEHPKYLSVKEIQLYVNMDMDDLFKDFIIADTQGASIIAGPRANKDIFNALDDSDAVFSICANRGDLNGIEFYENILKSYINYDENNIIRNSLKDRHFVLINLWAGQPDKDLEQTAKQLELTYTTNCAYLGSLQDENFPESKNRFERFVQLILIDMLKRISNQVLKFDQNRVKNCSQIFNSLSVSISELKTALNGIIPDLQLQFTKDSYIIQHVQQSFQKIIENLDKSYITNVRKEGNINEDGEEDFADDLDENLQKSQIYKTITGYETNFNSNQDPIKSGAEELCNKVLTSDSMKASPLPNDFGIIPYIGNLTAIFRECLRKNMHNIFAQKELDVTIQRDEIFTDIWDSLKIRQSLRDYNNSFIEEINQLYEVKYFENLAICPRTFYCHGIAEYYFSNTKIEKDDYENENLLDKDAIIGALTEEIKDMDIENIIKDHYVGCRLAMLKMYRELKTYFIAKRPNSEDILEFYLNHFELLTIDDTDYLSQYERYQSDIVLKTMIDKITEYDNDPIKILSLNNMNN